MNKFFSMMIAFMCAFALMACATTGSGYDPTEIARLRAENQRLRTEGERAEEERLCLQEYVACTTRGDRNCPETCAEAVTRQRREERQARTASATASTMPGVPMASPMSSVAPGLPTMPPLCPGVDPAFGSIPPWGQVYTGNMAGSMGAPLPVGGVDPQELGIFLSRGYYVSLELNGETLQQFAGSSAFPTMLTVRHPTGTICRLPVVGGDRAVEVRYTPMSMREGQQLVGRVWRVVTTNGVPYPAEQVGRCETDPRSRRSTWSVYPSGFCG